MKFDSKYFKIKALFGMKSAIHAACRISILEHLLQKDPGLLQHPLHKRDLL